MLAHKKLAGSFGWRTRLFVFFDGETRFRPRGWIVIHRNLANNILPCHFSEESAYFGEKKVVPRVFHIRPRVFHQTPRFPHPGTLYPGTPYPGTLAPRSSPSHVCRVFQRSFACINDPEIKHIWTRANKLFLPAFLLALWTEHTYYVPELYGLLEVLFSP